MLEKLKEAELRYLDMEKSLSDPSVFSDPERYATLMKEYKALTPVIETYRAYAKAEQANEEARLLLEEPLDSDMKELASAELKETKAQMEDLLEQLRILLLPRDPNDEKNVMVEIRSGAGGEEAALFAAVLYRMYTMYAESCGYKVSVMNTNETELGGFKEVTFMVEGDGV